MKKQIIFAALYIAFTAICFILSGVLPESADLLMKIWYGATIIVWCVSAAMVLSLSIKLEKLKRAAKRAIKKGKEKRK